MSDAGCQLKAGITVQHLTSNIWHLLFSFLQKTQERRVDFRGVLLLNPVVAFGEADFGVRRVHVVCDALDRFGDDGEVALAEDEERGDADSLLFGETFGAGAATEERAEARAGIINGGGERARLLQSRLEDAQVFVAERAGPRGLPKHLFDAGEVSAPEPPFGQRGQLEEE